MQSLHTLEFTDIVCHQNSLLCKCVAGNPQVIGDRDVASFKAE